MKDNSLTFNFVVMDAVADAQKKDIAKFLDFLKTDLEKRKD